MSGSRIRRPRRNRRDGDLIMLIGGRIVPSFTRNWLGRENPGRLPAFGRFDMVSMVWRAPR